MKYLLIFSLLFCFVGAEAQSFFNRIPPMTMKLGLSKSSVSLDSILNAIRPVVVISATVSDKSQLAGGAGFGYQRLKWNATNNAWTTMWSASLVGLLGTNGTKITGTGGLVFGIPGTNGLVNIGGGYDFTFGNWVFISGVQIQFN